MSSNSTRLRPCLFAAISVSCIAGCTVGPNFRGPPPVASNSIQAASFIRIPKDVASSTPSVAAWWESLHDPELTRLIRTALANSSEIQAAQARLRQARAGLREQRRNELPKGSATSGYVHADLGKSSFEMGSIGLYNAGFDATWEIDLFGGTRRAVEAASAEAAAAQADLADTHVQLSAEIAQAYINLRDEQQRIALLRTSNELEQQTLTFAQQRRAQGVASDLDVERIQAQVESLRANIIALDAQNAESLDRLAVLTGEEPGALDAELSSSADLPTLPETVAVGNPAALLKQRPDIRAAEWQLVSNTAMIGEKEAAWFPKLTLFWDIGSNASTPGGLGRSENLTRIAAPILQWGVLDFGRTKAGVDQAKAGYEEAEAKYKSAVLSALQDANTALSRYGHQRDRVVSLQNAEAYATRAAQLTQQRYRAGTASALDWLDAERTRLAAD
jgi:NodT family efflux transporter outer membrane factor (OMF) lipoprotein